MKMILLKFTIFMQWMFFEMFSLSKHQMEKRFILFYFEFCLGLAYTPFCFCEKSLLRKCLVIFLAVKTLLQETVFVIFKWPSSYKGIYPI